MKDWPEGTYAEKVGALLTMDLAELVELAALHSHRPDAKRLTDVILHGRMGLAAADKVAQTMLDVAERNKKAVEAMGRLTWVIAASATVSALAMIATAIATGVLACR